MFGILPTTQVALGLVLVASSLCAYAFGKKGRARYLLDFRTAKSSDLEAKTSPSLDATTAKTAPKTAEELFAEADYRNTLPPSIRERLAEVAPRLATDVAAEDAEPVFWPMAQELEDAAPEAVTPTGVSVAEIRALGDFPHYAALSGVPLPEACPGFDVSRAKARPYRPFRWQYHQTMSLKKLEPDWWLEIDSEYSDRIAQRQQLFHQHGKDVLDCLEGSRHACKELMEMCLQFLVARYPPHFELDAANMTFRNKILGTTSNLRTEHPMHVLLNNVPEDFAVMLRDGETGFYSFRAGLLCSSLGWNVATKIGMRLHEIHAPIPDYKEKMQFSMDRYFAKMPTDKPIQRGSWGLEVDTPLYMPPGDPHEHHRTMQGDDLTLDRCHLRVDWQTLRRLPLSGAIVFNFKALFTPVAALRDEAYVPSLVLKVCREGKRSLMEYKNTWHTEHVVLPALERYVGEQVERGLVPGNWEVETLDEQPFFPGWEEKWRGEQGF